jgi:hypothetical protein
MVALGLHLALAGVLLARAEDPAWFIHLGSQRIPVAMARQVLGPKVSVPHLDGHDGRFFWVQARDPLILHPATDMANVDRPAYRFQRIGYPALAAPWRVFGEYGLVWGLLITNLAIVAVGAAIATGLALDLGAPARASLAFAFNPAVFLATVFDFGDALAIAGIVAAMAFVHRRHYGPAIVAAVVATLAKEVSILSFVAIAVFMPAIPLRRRITLVAIPGAIAGLWGLYVRWRFGWPPSQIQEFTTPLFGYLDAYRRGWSKFGNWEDAIVAVVVLGIAVAVVVLWWRRRTLLLTAALPFALLVPFLSAQVLDLSDNSLRALGPVVTLLVLDCYQSSAARRHPTVPLLVAALDPLP